MNQKIFTMNLGVEAVSLYLLCCAVADSGSAITVNTLREKWNGSPDALEHALAHLEKRCIVRRDDASQQEAPSYLLTAEKYWQ